MATTNKNKLTTFKSGQTVVSATFMNSIYQAPNGETSSGNEAYGHVHDGVRLDGHAQKINLADHVDGKLNPDKIDGNILSQISLSESGTGSLTGDATVEPDGPTGSITFVAGNGIEFDADAENRTITFKSATESTTYTLSSIPAPGGAGIRLSDSNGSNNDVLIKQGSNVSVSRNQLGAIVITATDTTYTTSAQTIAGGALIRLTSSSSINDDLKLESGDGITVQRISADVIRISAQIPQVPLTTKGDILVYGNTGNERLPKGNDGQILSVNSNTITGLQWVNTITLPTTTAGDIIAHNGSTNIRIPIGTNGQILKVNTSLPAKIEWSSVQGGSGDVVGPATATDNAIARYNLGTGKLIQNSLVTIDDEGTLTGTIVRVGDDNSAGNVIIGDGTASTWAMVTTRGPNTSYRGMRIDNNLTEIWFAGSPNDSSGNYVLRSGGSTNVVTVTSAGNMTINGDLTVTGNDIKSSSATAITLSGADVNVLGDLTVTGNDIKTSTGTPITLAGSDVTVNGDLTIAGNDIKSSSAIAITLSGADVTVNGDLTIAGNDIKTSTGTPITLAGTSVTIAGNLTLNSGLIRTPSSAVTGSLFATSSEIRIGTDTENLASSMLYIGSTTRNSGETNVILGDLGKRGVVRAESDFFARDSFIYEKSVYTSEVKTANTSAGVTTMLTQKGRYFTVFTAPDNSYQSVLPNSDTDPGRVITLLNHGTGSFALQSNLFFIPGYPDQNIIYLDPREWVEMYADNSGWVITCGGIVPNLTNSEFAITGGSSPVQSGVGYNGGTPVIGPVFV